MSRNFTSTSPATARLRARNRASEEKFGSLRKQLLQWPQETASELPAQ
jgi:hypothetical protein